MFLLNCWFIESISGVQMKEHLPLFAMRRIIDSSLADIVNHHH